MKKIINISIICLILLPLGLFFTTTTKLEAQVENTPVYNPVYDFLLRAETKGYLPHFTLSQLPWQRKKVVQALELIRKNDSLLTASEKKVLAKYEQEFGLTAPNTAVVFYSSSDTTQVLSMEMFSNREKYVYHYTNNLENSTNNSKKVTNITIEPLAGVEIFTDMNSGDALLIGTLGGRIFGTFTGNFGYYWQVTNSAMAGYDSLALLEQKYFTNQKFRKDPGNNDADMTESHVAFEADWFYASIGRETRLEGAGLTQRLFLNNIAPAFDAITLAARFSNFEYKFSHNSLIGFPEGVDFSYETYIPPKYLAMHIFSLRPSWGEISVFESVIYSRDIDLAYLNPLSFFTSLEHAQHSRDNAGLGFTFTARPIKDFQIKASLFVDDIRFSKIGDSWWSNKTAWNIAGISSVINNLDFGIEYSRVEPYTYTHFNPHNSNTTDSILFSSTILPNSDRWTLMFQYWFGERYPVKLTMNYTRHGANIYDKDNNLIFNAGADPLQSIRWEKDSDIVEFLAGDLHKIISLELAAGLEIVRGFNINLAYNYQRDNGVSYNYGKLIFRFSDF